MTHGQAGRGRFFVHLTNADRQVIDRLTALDGSTIAGLIRGLIWQRAREVGILQTPDPIAPPQQPRRGRPPTAKAGINGTR